MGWGFSALYRYAGFRRARQQLAQLERQSLPEFAGVLKQWRRSGFSAFWQKYTFQKGGGVQLFGIPRDSGASASGNWAALAPEDMFCWMWPTAEKAGRWTVLLVGAMHLPTSI